MTRARAMGLAPVRAETRHVAQGEAVSAEPSLMRWVIGYEGLYLVHCDGRVFNRRAQVLAPQVDRYGYLTVNLYRDGKSRRHKVHRIVCEAWHGPCPDGRECGHRDSDKTNNAAANLAWVTRLENMVDRFGDKPRGQRKPRPYVYKPRIGPGQPHGERHGSAKLTADDVAAIRRRAEEGATQRALATDFGISRRQIRDIIAGKKWARSAAGALNPSQPPDPQENPHALS